MASDGYDAGERSGCLFGRVLGGLARLILVYPLLGIGCHTGGVLQQQLRPVAGTPYEGLLAGGTLGLLIGLSLWWSAMRVEGWRAWLAEVTLVLAAVIWLAGLVGAEAGHLSGSGVAIAWGTCLAAATVAAALLRA